MAHIHKKKHTNLPILWGITQVVVMYILGWGAYTGFTLAYESSVGCVQYERMGAGPAETS